MSNPWPAFDTYCWTGNRGIADALDAMFKTGRGGALAESEPLPQRARLKPGRPWTTPMWSSSSKARRPGPWAICGPATRATSRPPSAGTTCSSASPCSPTACRSPTSGMVPRARSGERDLRCGGLCVEPDLPALRDRRRPDGGPARAGVLQRGAGHGVARFQDARLFPEPQPVRQSVSGLPARAQAGGGAYQREALAALLHRRAQPHRAVVSSRTCGWPPTTTAWRPPATAPAR